MTSMCVCVCVRAGVGVVFDLLSRGPAAALLWVDGRGGQAVGCVRLQGHLHRAVSSR